ncbi:MAG: thioesterase [Gemmatimonadales bacterium]|nr:MAG: thioesterase [Gemmatimonadales bacterium]
MNGPFVVQEYVRWSDVDYAGIIFYGAYVRFFEIAETELFRAAGVPYGEVFDRFDIWLPRVHLSCDFEYPARLDDCLKVAAYFTRFGRSSVHINFDVVHVASGRIAAAAREVLVCVDRKTMRPRQLPDALKAAFERFTFTQEDARRQLGIRGEERAGG